MNVSVTPKFGMGASPRRIEDGSLIQGRGRYTTDVTPAGALTGYVLRSSAAHAKIKVGGLAAARSAPGVHLVWTAADVSDLAPMPCLGMGPFKTPVEPPVFPVLCGDVVRHVGDAIAFVVADDLNSAKSAAELIEVDYDTLPAVADTASALAPDAPLVWPERGSNLAFEYEAGDKAATDAAFAKAAKVATLTHRQQPARLQLHGAARRRRRIRRVDEPLHGDRRLAGRPRPPRCPVQGSEDRSARRCAS